MHHGLRPHLLACAGKPGLIKREGGRRTYRYLAALGLLVVAATGIACSSPHGAATNAPTASPSGPPTIEIKGFSYHPQVLRVRVGTRIVVRNEDSAAHTVTADDGAFDTGIIQGGRSTTITVTEPGDHPYHCLIHPYMTGSIIASG